MEDISHQLMGFINQLMTGGSSGNKNPELGMKYIVPCLCISIKKQLNNFADFYAFLWNTTEVFNSSTSGVRLN